MKLGRIALRVLGVTAVIMITLSPVTVKAIDEPTLVSVNNIEIFGSLLLEDDILVAVPYTVSFATQPEGNINQTYIFRILSDNATTEIGSALANPRYNGGYGSGVVVFYLYPGIAEWGEEYTVRVQQNPVYYPLAQKWDFTIDASAYSTATSQATGLKNKIIDLATFLTTEFGVDLLTKSEAGITVLSTYGELYFLVAIPGLQQMTPSLFDVNLETPDFTKRNWSTTFADNMLIKYEDTFVYDAMTGFAGLWSVETTAAMTMVSLFWMVVLIGISVLKFNGTMLGAATDGYALLLLLMLTGFFPMVAAGGIAFVSTVLGGVILFLNRA